MSATQGVCVWGGGGEPSKKCVYESEKCMCAFVCMVSNGLCVRSTSLLVCAVDWLFCSH